MTEIEKAVKEFGWGCIREGLLNPHLHRALLAAITRREAEVRAEALEEVCSLLTTAADAQSSIERANVLRQSVDIVRASLIKEQP